MLKKLKRKIILINMILVGVVLISVFFIVSLNAYKGGLLNINKALAQSVSFVQNQGLEQFKFKKPLGNETTKQPSLNRPANNIATVTVVLTGNGNIASVYEDLGSISTENLNKAVTQVINTDQTTGKLPSINLFYLKICSEGVTYVSFANTAPLRETMERVIVIAAVLSTGTMIVFFFISLLLAGIAIKPVKKAWEQQQQFVADASHELKTPLTVILANNNILLSHDKESISSQKKWVESTQDEALHMKKLVDNLLFLARSDAAENKFTLTQVPLSDILMESALQFEPVAFEKGVLVDTEVVPNMTISGDLTQIRQLVHILLDNGCKYAGENGRVFATLKPVGNIKRLSVKNTGTPIPAE
ncbi:MAG: HAMP domain-containing sensor histidine kinase, partial [Anaerovoracaceae bacterium]